MTRASSARSVTIVGLLFACLALHAQPPTAAPSAKPPVSTSQAQAASEVLELERNIAAAIVRGDTAYFDRVTSPDFFMVHGDAWTHGGQPALVDDKASFMRRVASKSYAVLDHEVASAEMHGDVAITTGRYVGHIPSSPSDRRWFYVWYQKIYAKRDGRWVYLAHRTVDGAHYAPDRQSLATP